MKKYTRKCIGESQFGALILCGCKKAGMDVEQLTFPDKGRYTAIIVDELAVIGSQYQMVTEFNNWLKIYDDEGLSLFLSGKKIIIYKEPRGECLIKVVHMDAIMEMAG